VNRTPEIDRVFSHLGKSEIVTSAKRLAEIEPTEHFAIDIETFGDGKKPGNCPQAGQHGIAGISLCNAMGEACYVPVREGDRKPECVPVGDVIQILNQRWFAPGKTAALHNAKFDLGFLTARGLRVGSAVIRDTWVLCNLSRMGVYKSNRLKDVVQELFGINVESETILKTWLEEHNTEDYGEVPIDLIGPYACDDVRYTLALHFHFTRIPEWMNVAHAQALSNTYHLIGAEAVGIALRVDRLRAAVANCLKQREALAAEVLELLGSVDVDVYDEQAMLALLHNRNLHSAPREMYGTSQYWLDAAFLRATENKAALVYLKFNRVCRFIRMFSADHGDGTLRPRVWRDGTEFGLHPSYQQSFSSKAGTPLCRLPDFVDGLPITNELRAFFRPRDGHVFVVVKPMDLALLVLAFYCNDREIMQNVHLGGGQICQLIGDRGKLSPLVVSLVLKRIVEGSGSKVLTNRLKAARIPLTTAKTVHQYTKKVEACFDYVGFVQRINEHLRDKRHVIDRCNRPLKVPQKEEYKAPARLIKSSVGSIYGFYFDVLCKLARAAGARLVMAHELETVFECPVENDRFLKTIGSLMKSNAIEPQPKWLVTRQDVQWVQRHTDAHGIVTGRWA